MNKIDSFRLSKWTHLIKNNGNYAVFHSLYLSLVFFESKYGVFLEELRLGTTINNLRKFSNEADAIIAELFKKHLVVPIDYDDNIVLHNKQKEYIYPPSLETIFILLTDVCNLNCKYCFINENMPKQYKNIKI